MFAERYGYSLDDFYSLTLRQICSIKRVIDKRSRKQREWDAALRDKKLKGGPEPLDITPEERKEYDNEAQKVFERMKREHGQGSRVTDKD